MPLEDFTASVRKLGLEGIVAKRSDSIYIPGRESDAWRKHRFNQEDEFVIGGYIPGGQNFSELLIGEEQGQELVFIKRLNAGFVPHTRAEVFEAIKGLRTKKVSIRQSSGKSQESIRSHRRGRAAMRRGETGTTL